MAEMKKNGLKIDLKKKWLLREEPLSRNEQDVMKILGSKDGWLACELPCDIHTPLIKAGAIKDPVLADYCFSSEWIAERSWWFMREFDHGDVDMDCEIVELCIESIDTYGQIFINGTLIGTSINAHHPFIADIKQYIVKGKNSLCVRCTTGLEKVDDSDLAVLNWATTDGRKAPNGRGDERRAFVRRPQYTTGWDWGPKAVTCGIVKGAYIRCLDKAVIRGANIVSSMTGTQAILDFTIEIDNFDIIRTIDTDVEIIAKLAGKERAKSVMNDILLTSGLNYIDARLCVEQPQLWWPSGYGDQPLYDIFISMTSGGIRFDYPVIRYGIRTIKLDTSRIDDKSRKFGLVVNDVPIFCKGGDWIPSDSIYARVTFEKYKTLISEAREANFNMLRIWGGGIYERDEFYDLCDEYGILIWHDFMFACSTYPDHLEWYKNEVDREMDYQTKRLRNHPSMALWCGNNENHWIFNNIDYPHWKLDMSNSKQYGLYTANVQAKIAIKNNCPQIPYWNSSPYGGERPNSPLVGDVHHWHECMMNPDMQKRIEPREYDKVEAKFVSEYGYPGPCPKESIEEYFDGNPIDRGSRIWELHTNTFNKGTVEEGIKKHYTDEAKNLDLDGYLLYSGLVQSLMLGYSLEALRFKTLCAGGLFWMYNDTWGEVGWTIIDYYLRRKISFYGVKRALAHRKIIIREAGGMISVIGCNDSGTEIVTKADVGYISLDGKIDRTKKFDIRMAPRSRGIILEMPLPDEDYKNGIFAVILQDESFEPAWLRLYEIKEMNTVKPEINIIKTQITDESLIVVISADAFAHGVHIKGNYRCSDNYFDLLPGQIKRISIDGFLGGFLGTVPAVSVIA